jgi:hypothetical protein
MELQSIALPLSYEPFDAGTRTRFFRVKAEYPKRLDCMDEELL